MTKVINLESAKAYVKNKAGYNNNFSSEVRSTNSRLGISQVILWESFEVIGLNNKSISVVELIDRNINFSNEIKAKRYLLFYSSNSTIKSNFLEIFALSEITHQDLKNFIFKEYFDLQLNTNKISHDKKVIIYDENYNKLRNYTLDNGLGSNFSIKYSSFENLDNSQIFNSINRENGNDCTLMAVYMVTYDSNGNEIYKTYCIAIILEIANNNGLML